MSFSYRCLTVGPLQENCYLLSDSASREAVLIDPGDEAARLLSELAAEQLTLTAIWLTHAHFDHVGALADIVASKDVPVHLHPEDEPLLARAAQIAAGWGFQIKQPPLHYRPLEAGQILKLGQYEFQCLFTPGHAPGHIAFYLQSEGLLFSGDALFKGSIGRTDLPLSNHEQLIASIRQHLLPLPDDTTVLPGHMASTTIAEEKQFNPFLG